MPSLVSAPVRSAGLDNKIQSEISRKDHVMEHWNEHSFFRGARTVAHIFKALA